MSKIVLAGGEEEVDNDQMRINYVATDVDEECFFLLYHLKVQPSEAYQMDPERRKWIIARAMTQKQMEQEMIERHRIAQQIMPNLKAGL